MGKITTTLFGDVMFFPYRAEAPAKEVLEWNTAVHESYNGTEERWQNRTSPRQSFEWSIPLTKSHKIDAINMLYGGIRNLVAVPVWTDSQYVGNITGGATHVDCDTSNYALRSASLAVLYNSYSSYQLVEIETIGGGGINIADPADSRVGAYLMPVRVGYIDNDVFYATDGMQAPTRFKFLVTDNDYVVAPSPTQYDSSDIYYFELTASGGMIDKAISKLRMSDDFTLGNFIQWSPWTDTRIAFNYSDVIQGAENIQSFRRFLARRAGMFRQFYYPTYERDFDIESTGPITTTIDVKSNNIINYAQLRDHCVFFDISGNAYPRHIDVWNQIDSDTVRLTLDTALNIDASQITLGCYLGMFRLNTDRVELNWIGNDVIKFSIPIIEIKPNRAIVPVIE